MIKFSRFKSRAMAAAIAASMVLSGISPVGALKVQAADFDGNLTSVQSVTTSSNVATVTFNDNVQARITFLEEDIFRYNVDPSGEFSEYARTNNAQDIAKIPQHPDSSAAYSKPAVSTAQEEGNWVITAGKTKIKLDEDTAKMTVEYNGKVVMEESEALTVRTSGTTQSLVKNDGENFFGGGTQNGRFIHTGESINIKNESNWVDGGVASPNPFYWSSKGYGVLRNTFLPGVYDFGKSVQDTVKTVHNENEYDAYYFLSDGEANTTEVAQDILQGYYHVTGSPTFLPEYGFYEGHLNCYNRDSWNDDGNEKTGWVIKGSASSTESDTVKIESAYEEAGQAAGYRITSGLIPETLNGAADVRTTALDNWPKDVEGDDRFSARSVIDHYIKYDMPLGYFVPNDGYGCGYGQNGYYKTGGVTNGESSDERIAAIDANVANMAEFTKYANERGIATGLWTQSNLSVDTNANTSWHLLRDFTKEVKTGGITSLKTDVAWVGHGYNFAMNSIKGAYDIMTKEASFRPNFITLDGWAGTHRYSSVWTGDQYGGNWEYIRFHIPTYIGQSLSGNPNVASDMDGIFGGAKIIATRDTQWKAFTPVMLNMDGWGAFAKTPQTFGDPYTGISRMYLKMKAQLMPYVYTSAASSSNIDTGNGDKGIPMVRAMFLEYPNDQYAATKNMQYQFMFGPSFLVAPIYQDTDMKVNGNDIRNNIYLPDSNQIWIDYLTGKQYQGGQVINNFDAPIWKLPVFVKNGAIIPMWEENNTPEKINKANRIVEFWPAGETTYSVYEDDGKTAKSDIKDAGTYGTTNTVDYGGYVLTNITSKVEGTTATLTASKADVKEGGYEGYESNKNTTFIVNVSKEPEVEAFNGESKLTVEKVNSKEEFDAKKTVEDGKVVVYYNANPSIEHYALPEEDEFIDMMKDQKTTPKLYVKFATTDTKVNEQKLVLKGFENKDASLVENKQVDGLAAPANLNDVVESKTPTSNTITWDAVDGATGYDVEVDGIINFVGNTTTFVHADQPYNSEHTYRVRTRNAEGYSEWSDVITAATSEDPYRNVPAPQNITWTGGIYSSEKVEKFFDNDMTTTFHSAGLNLSEQIPLIVDYGKAYHWDKIEYFSRVDFGNGTVYKMDVYASLDGVHWEKVHDGAASERWTYTADADDEANKKVISLDGKISRYLKFIPLETAGSFFGGRELLVHKKEDTQGFAVGSTNGGAEVTEADFTNLNNYKGESKFNVQVFNTQIKSRAGDINMNDYFDVYDYAFTLFNMNGGTQKTGAVSGKILLIPSKEEVTAGETFNVDVYADNVENLNAFGHILKYDINKLAYGENGTSSSIYISQMENLTIGKSYDGEESYISLAFVNKGNQETYSGSGVIATITLTAKEDTSVKDAIKLEKMWLIGPDFDFIECNSAIDTTLPEIEGNDGGGSILTYNTDFTMTITNSHLATDTGNNVEKLIQQNNYNGLFNNAMSRDFELKWDVESNYEKVYPGYIQLPMTISFELKGEKDYLNKVVVHNSHGSKNGYMTNATLIFNYENAESVSVNETAAVPSESMVEQDPAQFVFVNPNGEKKVTSVDLIINEAVTSSTAAMLTLSEIEIYGGVSGNSTAGNSSWGAKMVQSDFNITMTNEAYPADDEGTNVTLFIQQNNYNGLFDGIVGNANNDRDFEFKWDIAGNYVKGTKLPDYVTVPLTLHATMTQAKPVGSVSLYNSNKGNGYVTQASAVFKYADNTSSEKVTVTLGEGQKVDNAEIILNNPDTTKKNVAKVEVTIDKTESTVSNNAVESPKQMTLAEMKVRESVSVISVTGVELADDTVKALYKGEMADIKAVITPDNATNPYIIAESSDESVVRILTLKDENNKPVSKIYGVGQGKATITVTVLETAQSASPLSVVYEVEVLPGVNKTELISWIDTCSAAVKKFYTEETFAVLEEALKTANEVKDNLEATAAEVKEATDALKDAYADLVELPVKRIKDVSKFTAQGLNVGDTPDRTLDDKEDTYWESPYYGNDAGLPQELKIKLDKAYHLDKVEIVKSHANNGKVIEYEVLVSTDGDHYESVGRKNTPFDELVSGIRFEKSNVTHVKVIIHAATDSDGKTSANYARVAEVRFYGFDPNGDNTAPVLQDNVTWEAQSEASAKLTFAEAEDASGIYGYNITVTRKGDTSPVITIGNTNKTSLLLEGLVNGETYVVSITAVDRADNISEALVKEFVHKYETETPGASDNDGPGKLPENLGDVDPDHVPADGIIPEGLWIGGIEDAEYTGANVTHNFAVYDGTKKLVEKRDYTVKYKNNKNAYEAAIDGVNPKKQPTITVTGKGNYKDKVEVTFDILKVDFSVSDNGLVFADAGATVKNGKVKVSPYISYFGKKLSAKEFEIKGSVPTTEGTHTITLAGKGNFKGERDITLTISASAVPMDKVAAVVDKQFKKAAYTGNAVEPTFSKVQYKKDKLVAGTHYTVRHENNVAAGTASVILTAIPDSGYIGEKVVTFAITPKNNIAKIKVENLPKTGYDYTGSEIKPLDAEMMEAGLSTAVVKSNGASLVNGEDYTVSYTNNINKGTATMVITGIAENGSMGTKKVTFKIAADAIVKAENDFTITLVEKAYGTSASASDNGVSGNTTASGNSQPGADWTELPKNEAGKYEAAFEQGGARPVVVVEDVNGRLLVEGVDYTVSYKDNAKLTTGKLAKAVVKGKGNYAGTAEEEFAVVVKEVQEIDSRTDVTVVAKDKVTNNKGAWKQNIKVVDVNGKAIPKKYADTKAAKYYLEAVWENGVRVEKGEEITSKTKDAMPVGAVIRVEVPLKECYSGTAIGTYMVIEKGKDISKMKININPQIYTGEEILLDKDDLVSPTLNNASLTLGEHFEIVEGSYVKNINKGTAKVTFKAVEGSGYGGTKTVSFKINPMSVKTEWNGILSTIASYF